jgi:hypothetical protein
MSLFTWPDNLEHFHRNALYGPAYPFATDSKSPLKDRRDNVDNSVLLTHHKKKTRDSAHPDLQAANVQ